MGSNRGHGGPQLRPDWTSNLGVQPGLRRTNNIAWIRPQRGDRTGGRGRPRKGPGIDPNLGVEPGPRRAAQKTREFDPNLGVKPGPRRAANKKKKGARIRAQPRGRTGAEAGQQNQKTHTHTPSSTTTWGSNRGRNIPKPKKKALGLVHPNLGVEPWPRGPPKGARIRLGVEPGPRRADRGCKMRVDETPTLESKRGRGGPEKKTSGCDPHVRVESPVRPPPQLARPKHIMLCLRLRTHPCVWDLIYSRQANILSAYIAVLVTCSGT